LNICCVPSVLTFGSRQEAEKFQKGFGGQLLGMDETVKHLQGMMHMHSGM
jgi:DeoR family transcriptional regulator, copper-sensing transcriptional repressor